MKESKFEINFVVAFHEIKYTIQFIINNAELIFAAIIIYIIHPANVSCCINCAHGNKSYASIQHQFLSLRVAAKVFFGRYCHLASYKNELQALTPSMKIIASAHAARTPPRSFRCSADLDFLIKIMHSIFLVCKLK